MVEAFAYMDGRVDPPSSIHRLSLADLAAGPGEVWVLGAPPMGCVVLTLEEEALYISKLSVAAKHRHRGLANALIDAADARARELERGWLKLETRIELTENHRTFEAMGFLEVARTSHPGYDRVTSITFRRSVPYLRSKGS